MFTIRIERAGQGHTVCQATRYSAVRDGDAMVIDYMEPEPLVDVVVCVARQARLVGSDRAYVMNDHGNTVDRLRADA